ncbi:hypothetical protein A4X13_0g6932 [Tilletia indica]|uniref:Uncharacterized protein n=1 Tax=Tilletia indica TaxID=43049 RepID=A0A8T8SM50_9BASI|nr:hypothetical protein A4X13_0g6932 [Tilletia indica]
MSGNCSKSVARPTRPLGKISRWSTGAASLSLRERMEREVARKKKTDCTCEKKPTRQPDNSTDQVDVLDDSERGNTAADPIIID